MTGPAEAARPQVEDLPPKHNLPQVRDARDADLAAVQAIYAHHVRYGLASFEETPPSLEDMAQRRQALADRGLPYLVAELAGDVRGFAYAGPYRPRPAYRYTLENSVYVATGFEGRRIGHLLLAALVGHAAALGYRRMIAVIGDSGNLASIRLHQRLGFRRAGILTATGYKHGRWVDTVILERGLGEADFTLPEADPPAG